MTPYVGTSDFAEQPPKSRFRSGTGWTRVRTWRGPKTKLDDFLAVQVLTGGVLRGASNLEIDVEAEGYATITADFAVEDGTGTRSTTPVDPISRVWTLEGNDLEVSPFALPDVQTELSKITDPTMRALVVADIRSLIDGQREITDDKGNTTKLTADLILDALGGFPGLAISVLRNLIEAMASGIDAFPISQYVLRKTETVVPTATALKAQHLYVHKMFAYPRLKEHEPTLETDPTALLIDAANLATSFWQKRTPRCEPVGRGQWQIVQEYWAFKDYNKFVYGDPL